MQIVINIVVIIIILGVLISLHEAGHLAMAKLFKVYCFEYSIGFGPQLLHVKKKDGETYFTLRAFPIGGYVSMYGEEGAVPEGVEEPAKERSLENKKLYQKLLIMVAGVVVNYLLGLILIFVSCSAFPVYYSGYSYSYTNGSNQVSSAYVLVKANEDSVIRSYFSDVDNYVVYLGASYTPKNSATYSVFDGDVEVTIDGATRHYAAIYAPDTLTSSRDLLKDLTLYPLYEDDGVLRETNEELKAIGVPYEIELLADRSLSLDNLKEGDAKMELDITLLRKSDGADGIAPNDWNQSWESRQVIHVSDIENAEKKWKPLGFNIQVIAARNSWNAAWREWAYRVPMANGAIIKGLLSLFTPQGIQNVSGIVGMTAQVGTVMSLGGASMIFFYAGVISINLAFFNLLPFPGLDGWQIIVSIVESVSRKKIPAKVKGIVSFIGLGLLMLLMVFVAVKDIVGLI
ncbi:MAG: site-2 protease family protein [Candidatus Enteromonas sp.]|nr:site-2 protease family protein [Candidatus Enteromonas sp.]